MAVAGRDCAARSLPTCHRRVTCGGYHCRPWQGSTVDTHVKRLREKLGEAADYIETVRGAGYRFADEPGEAAMSR